MIEDLEYETDRRQDITDGRRRNFKQGWTRAVEGQEYQDVLEELTWNNLGWRLGKMFGETPDDLREEILNWCVEQQNATGSQ
jgi:hypothetical protein